jgi:hypothetical protein
MEIRLPLETNLPMSYNVFYTHIPLVIHSFVLKIGIGESVTGLGLLTSPATQPPSPSLSPALRSLRELTLQDLYKLHIVLAFGSVRYIQPFRFPYVDK